MSRETGCERQHIDPDKVRSQHDLALTLTILRKRAGLTVRELARQVRIPASTVGGYFSGSHLPRIRDMALILDVLRACGVTGPDELAEWSRALDRVYGLSLPTAFNPLAEAGDQAPARAIAASLRPPVERLRREPRLHGRTGLFGQLTQSVTARTQPRVQVLHGPGGAGKSFLALNLANWAMNQGVRTWWISAGDPISVAVGMRALAIELGASPRRLELGSPTDLAWQLLNGYRRPWLLVIDNADDPGGDFASPEAPISDAVGWLRPIEGRFGAAVVTTRDGTPDTWGAVPSWLRLLAVGMLDSSSGAMVLREFAGEAAGSREDAAAVADRLGGLPLTLRIAGSYLREAREVPPRLAWPELITTFAGYARALDAGQHAELLSQPQAARPRRSRVDQTWEISLEVLDSRGLSEARPLLRLLSCFALAPIRCDLLLAPEVLAGSELFAVGTAVEPMSGSRLWTLLRALTGFGLIDIASDQCAGQLAADQIVLHPVLRAVYRRQVGNGPDVGWHLSLLTALLNRVAAGLYPGDPRSWSVWRDIVVHCHSPLDLLAEYGPGCSPAAEGILTPAMLAAHYLRATGRFAEAEAAYSRLLERCNETILADDPDVLRIRQGLARVWYSMGRWADAEKELRALLTDRCQALGPDHQDTLVTQHYLGRVRHDQGYPQEAASLFLATLRARRKTLGPRDPATLSSMSNLGDAWRSMGRFTEAERMLSYVLRNRRELLGDDYPATLITREHLAALKLGCGVGPGDQPVFADLAADARRILGPDHPRTLAAEQLLGQALERLGDRGRALLLLERVLDGQSRTFGAGHPITRRTAALLSKSSTPGIPCTTLSGTDDAPEESLLS
jgi:tetratricopeptide (TPR) repeat protein/transcriptional regulator with XRE-family HTH domain